ncbi:MAG TPA: toll/interleukin-1 receptor domain-containing protein [Thermoleophilaceae bacterium]|nr:toll/interleukin-1 receptor domain-containing protein [Thermoleophilaceae bacterium]
MPSRVFISHAAADKTLADDVKVLLQTGIGVAPGEIFYSSHKGTGVPAGANFVEYIRDQMAGPTLVIAVITPAFRDSEFCLAELGAVWLAADMRFHPLSSPDIDRRSLQATLTGIQVEPLDQRGTLIELLQRVGTHFERDFNAPACDDAVSVFLTTLPTRLETLTAPEKVPARDLDAANGTIEKLAAQLVEARDELEAERRRLEELRAAKTRDEVNAIDQSASLSEAIEVLVEAARHAVSGLDGAVADAIPYHLKGAGMPWPDSYGSASESIKRAVDDGYLTEGGDGLLHLNLSWPPISGAVDSVITLQAALRSLASDEEEWFKTTYDVPPNLSQGAAFRQLVG